MQDSMRPTVEKSVIDSMLFEVSRALNAHRAFVLEPTYDDTLWHILYEWTGEGVEKFFSRNWEVFNKKIIPPAVLSFPVLCYEENVDSEIADLSPYFIKSGVKSAIMCSIPNENEEIAFVFIFASLTKKRWSKEEKQFVETISKFISLNLLRFRALFEKKLETVVFHASNILALDRSPSEKLDNALKSIANVIESDFTSFNLFKDGSSVIECLNFNVKDDVTRANFERFISSLDFSEINKKAIHKSYYIIEVPRMKSVKFPLLENSSIALFPIVIDNKIKGYFISAHLECKLWRLSEINSLSMFAQILSFSLENAIHLDSIKKNQKLNTSILNSTDDMIIMLGYDGKLKACNDAFLNKIWEKSKIKNPLGQDIFSILDNPFNTDFKKLVSVIYDKEETIIQGFRSEKNHYAIKMKNLFDENGKPHAFTVFIQNISKEKELEQSVSKALDKAKKASMAKSEFLASMSHEILTPLNAIMGYAYLLKKEELNNKQREFTENIEYSAENLLAIINEILDFSRIESGKSTSIKGNVSVRKLLDRVRTVVNHQAMKKGLELSTNVSESVPKILHLDEKNLFHVISNLVSNAVKYTEKGNVLINADINKSELIISVSDTGIGINDSSLEAIFTRFQRGNDLMTDKIPGTGLGLAIVKELVIRMNGRIDVDSKVGVGSVFTVNIPVEIKETVEYVGQNTLSYEDFRILVVDDNEINLSICENILKTLKFKVDIAKSGFEAIKLCTNNDYDCILMDHMMPKLDGIDTTKLLRKRGIKTPIIALTANTVDEYRIQYLNAGMNDMFEKPISVDKLETLLRRHL